MFHTVPCTKILCSYRAMCLPQSFGRQVVEQDRIGRVIAREGAMRNLEIGDAVGLDPPRASCRTPAPPSGRRSWPSANRDDCLAD
jgi:hypothetical protein